MKYKFRITGLRHHDYRGRLDELYELAPGRRMSISIEHDNPLEKDAVIVYFGNSFVGYVRSGEERNLALSIIQASGRGAILGKIVDVDRESRWLWMEITTDNEMNVQLTEEPNILTNWHFEGKILPSDEPEQRLHSMLCDLESTVENLAPWDDDMEQWLRYTEKNVWRDISSETTAQLNNILSLLTIGSKTHPEYKQKANRIQLAIDVVGSPEVRRSLALQVLQKADSKDMEELLQHYGDSAQANVEQLPAELRYLFKKDGEELMGRLWYFHAPYKKIQSVKTLLAMMVRLETEGKKKAATDIPEQWLMAWGSRQKDKAKAEVVREIISTFEMEKTNPQLVMEMQKMMDGCNSLRPTQINQLNMGNGTQQLPPDSNLPKLE